MMCIVPPMMHVKINVKQYNYEDYEINRFSNFVNE
jgi:hypothetical protein